MKCSEIKSTGRLRHERLTGKINSCQVKGEMKEGKKVDQEITINVNSEGLDEVIEKANRVVELLREAQQIIDSLSGKEKSKT